LNYTLKRHYKIKLSLNTKEKYIILKQYIKDFFFFHTSGLNFLHNSSFFSLQCKKKKRKDEPCKKFNPGMWKKTKPFFTILHKIAKYSNIIKRVMQTEIKHTNIYFKKLDFIINCRPDENEKGLSTDRRIMPTLR